MTAADVHLVVPAAPEYVHLARLTAAGLASRLGFSYDDIEDLRIAVDELCHLLLGPSDGDGTIRLAYSVEDTAMVITGEGPGGAPVSAGALGGEFAELSEQILAAVVDNYAVTSGDGLVRFRMVRRPRG